MLSSLKARQEVQFVTYRSSYFLQDYGQGLISFDSDQNRTYLVEKSVLTHISFPPPFQDYFHTDDLRV